MREWAEKVLGVKLPEDMSAADIDDSPNLKTAFDAAFERERLNQLAAAEGGREPSPKEREQTQALENTISQLVAIGLEKENFNTGPIQDLFDSVVFSIGAEGVLGLGERGGFKSRIRNVLQEYLRSLQGARSSDTDLKEFRKLLPGADDDDITFMSKTNSLIGLLTIKLANNRRRFIESGGEPSKFVASDIIPLKDTQTGEVAEVTAQEAIAAVEEDPRRWVIGVRIGETP